MSVEHHHKPTQLDRIEESVGRIEKSVGLQQAAATRIEERLNQMPVNADVQEKLDAVKASLSGQSAREHDEFLAAIQAAQAESAAKIDELNAKIDELVAGNNSDDLKAQIDALGAEVAASIDAIVPTGTPSPTAARRS